MTPYEIPYEVPIDDGIPLPHKIHLTKYPFAHMAVGQSFFAPNATSVNIQYWERVLPSVKFIARHLTAEWRQGHSLLGGSPSRRVVEILKSGLTAFSATNPLSASVARSTRTADRI